MHLTYFGIILFIFIFTERGQAQTPVLTLHPVVHCGPDVAEHIISNNVIHICRRNKYEYLN